MIESVLASKNLVAALLACATEIQIYFRYPFPADNLVLRLIAIRDPSMYRTFIAVYTLFLFTTPFILYSLVLSGLYLLCGPEAQPLRCLCRRIRTRPVASSFI